MSNTVVPEPSIVVGLDLSKQEYDPAYVLSTGETGTQANERRDRERRELSDDQADWLITRLEWTAGLHVGLSAEFRLAFGVGVELGVREEYREEARAAVRRIARLG